MCYFDGQLFDEVTGCSQASSYVLHHLDETWHRKKNDNMKPHCY